MGGEAVLVFRIHGIEHISFIDFGSNQSFLDQWEKYDEAFAAWVSDSSVRLKAIFTLEAAAQHENRIGKPITNDTVGNIIQLEEAEILASYLSGGPRTRKITLRINKIKLIGSDKSGQIGNPRPFDATHEFEELLQKLAGFCGVGANTRHAHGAQKTPEKPAGLRLRNPIPIDPDCYASQQLFSQVPVRYDPSNTAAMTNRQPLAGSRSPGGANNQTEKLMKLLKAKQASKGLTHQATNTTSPAITPVTSEREGPGAFTLSQTRQADTSVTLPKPKDRVRKRGEQKRIRSRDLRISKDQQDLLDSEDSWLPPKPGRRGPVANIPPAIHEEIVQSVKAKAAKQNSGEHEDTPKSNPEEIKELVVQDELEEAAETQPDVSISTQDWPPSSPDAAPRDKLTRYDLSPNNSPTTTNSMDLDNYGELQHDNNSPKQASSSENQNEQAQLPCSTPVDRRNSSDSKSMVVSMNNTVSADDDHDENTLEPRVDPSDSESELETSELIKFSEQNISSGEPLSKQEVPATAVQPQESVLQVKRTPYSASGHDKPRYTDDPPYPAPGRLASPSKRRRIDNSGRAHNVEDFEDQTHTSSIDSTRNHDLDALTSQSAQIQSSGVNETRLAHRTEQEAPWTQNSPKSTSAGVPSKLFVDPIDTKDDVGPNTEHPIPSPYVSKRRKLHNTSINFGFSQDEIITEDPSVTARRYREEYMARRKVSHPEARTSPYDTGSGALSISMSDNNAHMMSTGQSDRMADTGKQSLDPFGTAGDPNKDLPGHQERQDNASRSSQRYHPEATSLKNAASPHRVAERLIAVNERYSSPELGSNINPATSLEQSRSALENTDVHPALNSVSTKVETISSTYVSQQSNLSRQARSLPELMTPALSQTYLPEFPSTTQDRDTQSAIYHHFRSVYPEYHSSLETFLGMCRKIEQLFRCDRMEHKSLWDDFIVRYQLDYPQYLERCVEQFEDPKTYERFYRDEIDEPKFNKRVLLPSTLAKALPLGPTFYVSYDTADTVATRESPITTPGVRRPLSSEGINRSSHVLGAVDTALSSRQPHITKDKNRKHSSKDQLEDSSVKRHTDQLYVPRPGQTVDSITQISSPSTPPAVNARLPAEGLVPKPSRRLPWLQDTTTASEDNRKRTSPVVPLSRRHHPERTGSKHSATVTDSAIKKVPEHSRPRLLEQSHRARSRGTKNHHPSVEGANTSGPRGAHVPDKVDEGGKDDPTSLQGFARFYQAIKPGRGNSWARKEDCKTPKAEVKGGKALNIMEWRL